MTFRLAELHTLPVTSFMVTGLPARTNDELMIALRDLSAATGQPINVTLNTASHEVVLEIHAVGSASEEKYIYTLLDHRPNVPQMA